MAKWKITIFNKNCRPCCICKKIKKNQNVKRRRSNTFMSLNVTKYKKIFERPSNREKIKKLYVVKKS